MLNLITPANSLSHIKPYIHRFQGLGCGHIWEAIIKNNTVPSVGAVGLCPEPLEDQGIHSLSCWRGFILRLMAEALSRNYPWLKGATSPRIMSPPQRWPRSNNWSIQGYKVLAPLPWGHPSSRVPHGISWGLCCNCIVTQFLPLLNATPLPPCRCCSQAHSPITSVHRSLSHSLVPREPRYKIISFILLLADYENSWVLTSLPTYGISRLTNLCKPKDAKWACIVLFCASLITSEVEHLFNALLATPNFSSVNQLDEFLLSFLLTSFKFSKSYYINFFPSTFLLQSNICSLQKCKTHTHHRERDK